jgi:hypothetical protein
MAAVHSELVQGFHRVQSYDGWRKLLERVQRTTQGNAKPIIK